MWYRFGVFAHVKFTIVEFGQHINGLSDMIMIDKTVLLHRSVTMTIDKLEQL